MKHLLMLLCWGLFSGLYAQQTQTFTENGASLSHYTSAATIPSGASYGYIYTFTIPAGTKVAILDADIQSSVEILTQPTLTGTCNAFLTSSSLPSAGQLGGNIGYKFEDPNGLAQDISGTVVFSTRFPNGVTCNGATATNDIGLKITMANGSTFEITTTEIGQIETTATAQNYWSVQKNLVSSNWFYGPGGSSCPRSFFQREIVYEFVVSNGGPNGTQPYGQLNLYNAKLTDLIAGLNGTIVGFVTPNPVSVYDITPVSVSPVLNTPYSNVEFGLGDLLVFNGAGPFVPTRRRFWVKVLYDATASGCKTNQCELKGSLGGINANNPCVPESVIDTDAETIHLMDGQTGFFSKQVRTNNAPGCPIYYALVFSAGATPMTFTHPIVDQLPALPSPYVWQAFQPNNPPSGTCSMPSFNPSTGEVKWDFSTTCPFVVPINQTRILDFYISLDPNLPLPYPEICNDITVTTDLMETYSGSACFTPSVSEIFCLYKEVLDPQPNYTSGDLITYRLRIQNLGTTDLPANGRIEEYLSDNFEYIGIVNSYSSPTFPPVTTSPWGVNAGMVSPSTDPAIQIVPFTIPSAIGKSCGPYSLSCSSVNIPPAEINNGQPFYYIEFQVRVRNESATGVVANNFSIFRPSSTVSLGTSNNALVQLEHKPAFEIKKSVRASASDPWGQVADIGQPSGSTAEFEVVVSPVGTPVFSQTGIVDLLPKNNANNDVQILNRTEGRAAEFDFVVSGTGINTVPPADYWNAGTTANNQIDNWQPLGLDYFPSLIGSTGTTNWLSGINANDKNIGFHFNPQLGTVLTNFEAKTTQQNPADRHTCNSAAGNIAIKLMEGSAPFRHWNWGVVNTPVESNLACVETQEITTNPCCMTLLDTVYQCIKPIPAVSFMTICLANQSAHGSNICEMTITPSNTNMDWGSVYLDQNTTPLSGVWDASEDLLTLNFNPSIDPFAPSETHCLQLNYSGIYSGSLTITVDYCETGCDTSFVWTPENVSLGENKSNIALTEKNPGQSPLYAVALQLKKTSIPDAKKVKFVSFKSLNTDAKIIAATGAALEVGSMQGNILPLNRTLQNSKEAMFILPDNASILDESLLNLVFEGNKPTQVQVILMAENGDILHKMTYPVQ
ncbi:MAG: hypothetical protein RIR11_3569 [Bacteroidota bacterium]